MNSIILRAAAPGGLPAFRQELQAAFQKGYEDVYGPCDGLVLPDDDISGSLNEEGAEALEAVRSGERLGGAIVTFSADRRTGHLDFLYVKAGCQNHRTGQFIWSAIEARYPGVQIWETMTPYFDRRNIHFYVNRCGFRIVEFFNEHHPDPAVSGNFPMRDGMFRFEKRRDVP